MLDQKALILAFIAAINSGNIDQMALLMSADHVLIDSLGSRIEGRDAVLAGWGGYFKFFPDYRVEIDQISIDRGTVLATGWASATLHKDGKPVPDGHWRIPAAWRATVREGKITEWQVYADNKPVYELLAAHTGSAP
jgi:ketosteroid isomerase-like protein